MKDILTLSGTSLDTVFCELQGKLFSYFAEKPYDMETFFAEYMASEFCRISMDGSYSYYQVSPPAEIVPELARTDAISFAAGKENDPDPEDTYFAGFLYKYLQMKKETYSSDLARLIPLKDMLHLVSRMQLDEDLNDLKREAKALYEKRLEDKTRGI